MALHLNSNTVRKSFMHGMGLACVLSLTACGGGGGGGGFNLVTNTEPEPVKLTGCADTDSCASNPDLQIGGERPAQAQIPSNYTTTTRYPLLILLHGFGASGALQSAYLGLNTRVDQKQYVLVIPDGTENITGARFWNATPACCAFQEEDRTVDDVAYIRGLIEEAAATYSIDPERIGLVGHSNGGFMALRMACEASDLVTSVVSLAGSTFEDDSSCAPATNPVSVLTMHGDLDLTIPYTGRQLETTSYPGALETTRRFAAHAGCNSTPVTAPNLDVLGGVAGAETEVLEYTGCDENTDVTHWKLVDGPHIPFPWVGSALDLMVDWIVDHRRS
ncbi:MAG: prolyl oligopeptidase family serine peptidase [Halioglobus sp.]|nr:prolyl oligopeptidase family serine peptidase [Halioglobus sp.]